MKSLPPGTARILPTEVRIRQVEAASEARNTHFSHISCTMFSLATEPVLPLAMTSAMARTRSESLPSRSPKLSDCIGAELNHLARLVEGGGDRAEAAEHALAPELLVEHIQMQHAVEQRDDRGLRPDRRGKRCDGVVEVERLAAQQHDIEFFGELVGLHRRRILQCHVAMSGS